MSRAKIYINPDIWDEIIVNITGGDVYPTSASEVAETWPQTLTAKESFYATVGDSLIISLKSASGVEMGQYAEEAREIRTQQTLSFKPQRSVGLVNFIEDRALLLGSPALGATTAVHAAVTDTGEEVEVTTGITNPAVPRNITATSGGTANDIGAVQVVVEGTNMLGETITETLPIFTENSATTVVGSKAFATVTSITIPAHDGTGATTAIGTGAKLGLPGPRSRNMVLRAWLDDVLEGTAPTVTFDADACESNTVTLNSALDGSEVRVMIG